MFSFLFLDYQKDMTNTIDLDDDLLILSMGKFH